MDNHGHPSYSSPQNLPLLKRKEKMDVKNLFKFKTI